MSSRLVVFVGLVCGHFKSQGFAESLAWQLGVSPAEIDDVDFRVKNLHRPASDYDFGVRRKGEQNWRLAPTAQLVGGNWGHGAFQPRACDFCDDVVAETADVSFGDAWLERFKGDSRGTNLVISRNRSIDRLFDEGLRSGAITTESLTHREAVKSQAGGFRHRRDGLAVRLADDMSSGLSVPLKRVEPSRRAVRPRRVRLVRQRRRMAELSHLLFADAVATGNLEIYLEGMESEIARYKKVEVSPTGRLVRRARLVVRPALKVFRGLIQ